MVERRSMGQAMEIGDEKLSFIRSGTGPTARATNTDRKAVGEGVSEEETRNVDEPMPEDAPVRRTGRRGRPPRAAQRAAPPTAPAKVQVPDTWKVPITTKLRYSTMQALRQAYLRQKLNHATPATQQEIVEDAVQEWLRSNGFLSECD